MCGGRCGKGHLSPLFKGLRGLPRDNLKTFFFFLRENLVRFEQPDGQEF